MIKRDEFLKLIHSNITKCGHHITVVSMSDTPRFAYSIGMKNTLGFELIFAGCIFYMHKEISIIIDEIASQIKENKASVNSEFLIDQLGSFKLAKVKESWSKEMMLGVYDYFDINKFDAFQIVPQKIFYTNDIPDMSKDYNHCNENVWRWLTKDWTYSVPKNSIVYTNLDALRGNAITEIMRWEENEWEMFAGSGPEIPKEEIRIVPLGTIIGIDKSLMPSLELRVNEGIWRNDIKDDWNKWK